MDSDSSDIIAGPARHREASDEDDIAGVPAASSSAGPAARAMRVRGTRPVPERGCFTAWLVGVNGEGPYSVHAGASDGALPGTHSLVGLCSCEWQLVAPNHENVATHIGLNPGTVSTSAPWGYLQYTMVDMDILESPIPVPEEVCPGPFGPSAPLHFLAATRTAMLQRIHISVFEWIQRHGGRAGSILLFPIVFLMIVLIHMRCHTCSAAYAYPCGSTRMLLCQGSR